MCAKEADTPAIVYDHVLVLGPGIDDAETLISTLTQHCEQKGLSFCIIGDGKNHLPDNAFEQLDGHLGAKTRIDINGHGTFRESKLNPPQKEHYIHVFKNVCRTSRLLDELTVSAEGSDVGGMQVHLWSCYGGVARSDIQTLPFGVFLINHASDVYPTSFSQSTKWECEGICRYPLYPLEEFAHVIVTSPETSTLSIMLSDEHRLEYTARTAKHPITIASELGRYLKAHSLMKYAAAIESIQVPSFSGDADKTSYVEKVKGVSVNDDSLMEYMEAAYIVKVLHEKYAYVEDYLDKTGQNPDAVILPHEETALYHAVTKGDGRMVRLLIGRGADAKKRIEDGSTYVGLAVQLGYKNVLKLLIEEGHVELDLARNDGLTPLMMAVQKGSSNMVTILLRHQANPNVQHSSGIEALHLAAQYGHTKIAEALITHGADVTRQYKGMGAIEIARSGGHEETANVIKATYLQQRREQKTRHGHHIVSSMLKRLRIASAKGDDSPGL